MNERETKGQKPRIARLSLLALMSGILSIVGLFLVSVGVGLSQHFSDRTNLGWANPWNIDLAALSISVLSIIIGSIGFKKIEQSKGLISGKKIVRHGRLISVITIIWACLGLWIMLWGVGPREVEVTKKYICQSNIKSIGESINVYANDYDNEYPTAEKWCDLLVKYSEAEPKRFICPSSGTQEVESNYAFNKNLIGKKCTEIPPDVVVLFEAKAGRNQFGGPEILTTENHKGRGSNILFNSGHVEFVKSEQLGELNWGNEKE